MTENNSFNQSFFAAANGYSGFVSYFNEIFSSFDFDLIFLLSAGPGTGKSSLMKSAREELIKRGFSGENILCSSVPSSLDGIIAEREDKRIAIIDATLPHARPASLWGVSDICIDFSDSLDLLWLKNYKKEIIALSKSKANAYAMAYRFLRLAGHFHRNIKEIHMSRFDEFGGKIAAESILSKIRQDPTHKRRTRLISSFGRMGVYKTQGRGLIDPQKISISGNEFSSEIFMDILLKKLNCENRNMTVYPSAPNNEAIELIEFPDSNISINIADEGEFSSDAFLTPDLLLSKETERLLELKNEALKEAKSWFNIASDIHFRLEEIYGEAMNFERNSQFLAKILEKVDNIL